MMFSSLEVAPKIYFSSLPMLQEINDLKISVHYKCCLVRRNTIFCHNGNCSLTNLLLQFYKETELIWKSPEKKANPKDPKFHPLRQASCFRITGEF